MYFVCITYFLVVFLLLLIENTKILVYHFVFRITCLLYEKKQKRGRATKKVGEFSTPNDYYLRAPIIQPIITAENYEINPNFLNLVGG
jgi:hypothetical protein